MALPNWQRNITDTEGNVVAGAEIEVVNEATGLPADIYSDRAGTTTKGTDGVFFATAAGFAEFYAAPGEYRITATGPSGSQTWRYEVLAGTAAKADVVESAGDDTTGRVLTTDSDVYRPANIVGTVSQSGGVPTDAIFERGLVSGQGEYTKYADGTMTCYYSTSTTSSNPFVWTFPKAFVGYPAVTASCDRAAYSALATKHDVTASSAQITTWTTDGAKDANGFSVVAVGRWFT